MRGAHATAAVASPDHSTGRHGDSRTRGLSLAALSADPPGRFGRLFHKLTLKRGTFGSTTEEVKRNLKKLGDAMSATFDPPKDGKDEEESGIPALYTYFGQFVDHDITFDPTSSLQKQKDPDGLTDFRTPALDLDNIYGRGPNDQPYLYTQGPSPSRANQFLLGAPIYGGNAGAKDVPRNNADPARALIGDPRNDENAIVSQLQGLFLRFHNRTATENPHLEFEEVQQLVRFHYQYVVLHDFLPRIIHSKVLAGLKSHGRYVRDKLRFFHPRDDKPYMPVEFSVAAYRLGHSMIRPGYRLNDANLRPIFPVTGFPEGLTGFQAVKPTFGIDWGRFIDIDTRPYDGTPEDNQRRLQFAYRIDTSLVNPLSMLPPSVVSDAPASLAERNLLRGWALEVPTGQQVAREMEIKPLADDEILIGKAVDKPAANEKPIPIRQVSRVFADHCPLWTYILAEAMHYEENVKIPVEENVTRRNVTKKKEGKAKPIIIDTPRLGPVGGRIVAEVLLGLMFADQSSLLWHDPNWRPTVDGEYALKDFVAYALG